MEDNSLDEYLPVATLLGLELDVEPTPSTVADGSRLYLFPEVVNIVLEFASDDGAVDDFVEFLRVRGALLLATRWVAYRVRKIPFFWTRLVVSPSARLSTLRKWIFLSARLPLHIQFRVVQPIPPPSFSPNNHLDAWLEAAVLQLCMQMDRYSSGLVEDVLFYLESTKLLLLRSLDITFRLDSFRHLRPFAMEQFAFRELPALGVPFRPFTSLIWVVGDVASPTATYFTADVATCSIVQPASWLISWSDAMAVITCSLLVSSLVLDGLSLDYRPGSITCSAPLVCVVDLAVTFHDSDSMAELVSHLNLPCLKTLRVNITATRDVQRLCTCSALLASIDELILSGSCPSGNEFYAIYSLMRVATCLDICKVSKVFYSAFDVASRRPQPPVGTNWNACPRLERLLVHDVSLSDLRALMLSRRDRGYQQLQYVMVCQPTGGWDATVDAWFQAEGSVVILPSLEARVYIYFCLSSGTFFGFFGFSLFFDSFRSYARPMSTQAVVSLAPPVAPIDRLPNEMLTKIFDHVCEDSDSDDEFDILPFHLETDPRDILYSTHTRWRNVISAAPHYWCKLSLDRDTSPAFVERHVSNVGELPLDVSIFLDVDKPPRPHLRGRQPPPSPSSSSSGSSSPGMDSSDPIHPLNLHAFAENARECLTAALPAVRLWQNVSFWTSTDVFLLEFLRLYANADAPLLESLLFACPSTGRNRRPCDGLFVTPPMLFRGHLPNLSELRLLSATLPWDARGCFGRLFALDIRNLPGVGWPTVPAFIGALVASTALRHLVLGGAGVVVDHASVIHAFTLPSLETLAIVYSERAMGFITLLAACSFPVLKEFNAYDFDRVAWAAILHLAFFDQLERCSISGSLSSVVHIPVLQICYLPKFDLPLIEDHLLGSSAFIMTPTEVLEQYKSHRHAVQCYSCSPLLKVPSAEAIPELSFWFPMEPLGRLQQAGSKIGAQISIEAVAWYWSGSMLDWLLRNQYVGLFRA
ncbi:hypothetical protein B0H13DRAFT_1861368 [Mycena leptocephala]|nr:hypothetical protein B0H13DRAFT_1861368 [Mycena leptocephala]